CFVSDLIEGFSRLMANGDAPLGPVNLGNPVETTVGELAVMITGMVGSRSKIVYKPLPVDDPRRRRPDITQARTVLGWSPKVELAVGLQQTIAYFDDQLVRNDGLPLGATSRGVPHRVGTGAISLAGALS